MDEKISPESVMCLVTISDEDGKIAGAVKDALDGTVFEFDPLTALCDLVDTPVFIEGKGRLEDTHVNHPFFMGREYEGVYVFPDDPSFSMMIYALNSIKSIVVNNRSFSLSELEIARQVFDLSFSCRIEFKQENPLYGWGYTVNPINGETVTEFQYLQIDNTFDFDADKVFDVYKDKGHKFSYTCYNLEDIFFSSLHYLSMMKYQFNECNHCGKYFATKTLKNKYCNRKSPYSGYGRFTSFENTQCEQAVRDICQEIRREIKRIDVYTRHLDDRNGTTKIYDFLDKCDNYRNKMNKCFTAENLKGFEKLLIDYRAQAGINKRRIFSK